MSKQIRHLIFITFLSALLFACGGGVEGARVILLMITRQ